MRTPKNLTQLKNHKFIIFGAEFYNPMGIIRSLGEYGIRPDAVIIRDKIRIASYSRYIDTLTFVDSVEEGYKLLLSKYTNGVGHGKPIVLTGGDQESSYLDMHYDELKDYFIFYNAGSRGRITHFMNKDNINRLAVKHGLKIPDTVVVKKGVIPDHLQYPIMTKSLSSNMGGKSDVFICYSEKDLQDAYKTIKSSEVLLQQFIEKKNELCLDGYSINQGRDVFISMGSSYEYILKESYSQYMRIFNYDDPDMLNIINGMLSEIGFEGIFSIEFLIDKNDQMYFLEINLRNSTWSYASTRLGMNLPALWSYGMVTGLIPEDAHKKIEDNFKAMVEWDDFILRVVHGRMNVFTWLRQMFGSDCLFFMNARDPLPFPRYLLSYIRYKIKHHIRSKREDEDTGKV